MKNKQIENAAKIYAANVVRNSLGTGAAFFSDLTPKEANHFQKTIYKIADILSTVQAFTIEDAIKIATS